MCLNLTSYVAVENNGRVKVFLHLPLLSCYYRLLRVIKAVALSPLTHYFAHAVMVTTAADASCGNR